MYGWGDTSAVAAPTSQVGAATASVPRPATAMPTGVTASARESAATRRRPRTRRRPPRSARGVVLLEDRAGNATPRRDLHAVGLRPRAHGLRVDAARGPGGA